MQIHRVRQRKQLSLLLAALLLLANTLVTVHAFGEATHAVADSCELLHQMERQQQSPVAAAPVLADSGRHVSPADASPSLLAAASIRYYQSRAPPFA